jgi:hypothetical protein
MEPSLEGAYVRLDRAHHHALDVAKVCTALAQEYANLIGQELDSDVISEGAGSLLSIRVTSDVEDTDHPLMRVPKAPDAPMTLSVRIGEVVYNLRAALDYLVYELAYLHRDEPCDGTQFPIEDYEQAFNNRRTGRRVRGRYIPGFLEHISIGHFTAIKRLQPCHGCNWTKTLRDISNPDKHRHLTVAGQRGFTILGMSVTKTTDTEVEVNLPVMTFVAFEDGSNVIATLSELLTQVRAVLEQFKPCFEGECGHH